MLKDVLMWCFVLAILLVGFAFALASVYQIDNTSPKIGKCMIELFWAIFLMTVVL